MGCIVGAADGVDNDDHPIAEIHRTEYRSQDADIRLGEEDDVTTRLIARVSPKSRIALGQPVELAVDTTRLYFFDPETRKAI